MSLTSAIYFNVDSTQQFNLQILNLLAQTDSLFLSLIFINQWIFQDWAFMENAYGLYEPVSKCLGLKKNHFTKLYFTGAG